MMAQTDLNSLKSEASTTQLMTMFIKDETAQAYLTQHLENLDREISHSWEVISQLNQDASALCQLLLPSVPTSALPQITAMPTENSPAPSLPAQCNKCPCIEQDSDDGDKADACEVASSSAMQINTSSQVTVPLPHPSPPFLNVPISEVKLAHSLTFEGGHIVSPFSKTAPVSALSSLPLSSSPFTQWRCPPPCSSLNLSCSAQYLHFMSYLIILLFILPHVLLASASAAFAFCSIAINANGLSDPMKIAALVSMTRSAKPHVLVIGEMKSVHCVSARLTMSDYDFHENPGLPVAGTCNCGKWGVIIGVRRGLFNIQPVQLHPSLDGCVLALDLIIPTTEGGGFTHHLIGIYAPWDPGNHQSQHNDFWHSLSTLCSSSPFSWSIHGDFNATLSFMESSSTSLQVDNSHQAYSTFLQEANGLDLWQSQPDYSPQHSFTYQAHQCQLGQQTPVLIQSTIDRVATSQHGIHSGHIHVLTLFHVLIIARYSLLSYFQLLLPYMVNRLSLTQSPPQFMHLAFSFHNVGRKNNLKIFLTSPTAKYKKILFYSLKSLTINLFRLFMSTSPKFFYLLHLNLFDNQFPQLLMTTNHLIQPSGYYFVKYNMSTALFPSPKVY